LTTLDQNALFSRFSSTCPAIWCTLIAHVQDNLTSEENRVERPTTKIKPTHSKSYDLKASGEGNVTKLRADSLSCALCQDLVTQTNSYVHSALLQLFKLDQRDEQLPGRAGDGAAATIGLHSLSTLAVSRSERRVYVPLFALLSIGVATVAAADPAIHIELNAAETMQQDHCRLSFVVQNSAENAIDTLKLDLALFDREGTIKRRVIVELGPLRAAKTIVRTFNVEADCGQIGSILVNDVTACAPGEPEGCVDRLTLSSRLSAIRFFK